MCWKQQDLSNRVYISKAEIAEENRRGTTSFGEKVLFICIFICLFADTFTYVSSCYRKKSCRGDAK